MMNVVDCIPALLDGYLKFNDVIDISKIKEACKERYGEKKSDYFGLFYERYNTKPQTDTPQTQVNRNGTPVFSVRPFDTSFNKDSFWFKEENPSVQLKTGSVMGYKNGIKEIFRAGEFLDAGEIYDNEAETRNRSEKNPTSFIHVYFPEKNRRSTNSFFHMRFGKALTQMRHLPGIRVYFNLKGSLQNLEAISLFLSEEIQKYLDDRLIPFQLKTPYFIENFNRKDNCVLYLAQAHFWLIREHLQYIAEDKEYKKLFEEDLPLFMQRPFKGVGIGLAEDPIIATSLGDGNESFGQHRINLILESILEGDKKECTILDLIDDLKEKGYSTEEFFRNPGTKFNYSIPGNLSVKKNGFVVKRSPKSENEGLNNEALKIALKLLQKAHYFDGEKPQINWVSCSVKEKEIYYSYLNRKDCKEIILFLDGVLKIEENRKLFPSQVLSIISDWIDFEKEWHKDSFDGKYWNEWLDNIEKIIQEIISAGSKRGNTRQVEEVNEKMSSKSRFKSFFSSDPIGNIYQINIQDFENGELEDLALQIYNLYTSIDYPIKNRYGNYEFDPVSQARIGSLFLFIYCPAVVPAI